MYYLLLCFICISVPVQSWDYHEYDDFPSIDYHKFGHHSNCFSTTPPTTRKPPKVRTTRRPEAPEILNTLPRRETMVSTPSRMSSKPSDTIISTPPSISSKSSNTRPSVKVTSRIGEDLNNVQQREAKELYCLEVLGNLVAAQWREEINKIPVTDLGNISTVINIPDFKGLYSNPESEWIQDEGNAFDKLDTCVRNLVSSVASRMDQDEIQCLNDLYPAYLTRENDTAKTTERFIRETSQEQLPFRSFYSYFDLTQILFDNKNIDALDDEVRSIHEDLLEFYIKTEDDKDKKIFIIEQECEWKDVRDLREASTEDLRYEKFRQLVRARVNLYLVAEILRNWMPGAIIPEYRYNVWTKARAKMENEIQEEIKKLRSERRDAQYLCVHAARMGNKFLWQQKALLFDKMPNTTLSAELATYKEYAYAVALQNALTERNDYRRTALDMLATKFKDGHYCMVNFVRMVENHQRHTMATAFTNENLPYGKAYCWIAEMSADLVQPRYCKCQGSFCEQFGLATLRAVRFQLNRLPNNTYAVTTDPSYRVPPLDELIESANQRIFRQKFNTFWYRHQKHPPKPDAFKPYSP